MHLYYKSRDWVDNTLYTVSPKLTRWYWSLPSPFEGMRAVYYLAKIRYLKWCYDEALFDAFGPKQVARESVWLASLITMACALGILASITCVLFVI